MLTAAESAEQPGWLTTQDLAVVGRVLHFTDAPPAGEANLAIVYAAGVPGSEQEARSIASELDGGLQAGNLTLRPKLTEQQNLSGLDDLSAVVTAAGVSGVAVREVMRRRHIPCLTGHLAQVKNGSCLVGIQSLPSVSIQLNGEAAAQAGIRFATAFRMMVQEL